MQQSLTELSGALSAAPLSASALLLALAIGAVFSLILGWHFTRFGRSLSNRAALAKVFPLITLTTVLIISVVKSSLALSLGLVGALSIVRFRTPVKEPEELAYLFLSIAIGLALGAGQILATLIGAPIIMVLAVLPNLVGRGRKDENLFLNVSLPTGGDGSASFQQINALLAQDVKIADLRRMDASQDLLEVTYFIHCEDDRRLLATMDRLKSEFPQATVSFVEQQNFLGG